MNKRKPDPADKLAPYRAKRSAGRTGEPFAATSASRPHLFVVQKHSARRLHYDFRLEWGGTLVSWAVPNGPSPDPADKRLAVHVEDHPVEYADFEGVIPKGEYGAGPVVVWDMGRWVPLDDPEEGLRTGKLHFELRGYKLRGVWLLIKTQGGPKHWLLLKKPDGWVRTGDEARYPEESILSGLTVEELAAGQDRTRRLREELVAAGAAERPFDPQRAGLMLARTADGPFSSPDWIYELKYDGYRVIAWRGADGRPLLRSRNGQDLTPRFPEIARALRALPYDALALDGELVVMDPEGRASFDALQQRGRHRRRIEIEHASVASPAALQLFDLLHFDGLDVRPLPLLERKRWLAGLLPSAGPLRYTDHIAEQGEAMFEQAGAMQLEGLIAKRAEAPYRAGRSGSWLKVVIDRNDDFVVCGFTAPKGSRVGFGALHLGAWRDDTLVYVGRVGTGFDDAQLAALHARLEAIERDSPPCTGELPPPSGDRWVEPTLVAEVRFKTWTDAGHLRHPVFSRLREDKDPRECRAPAPTAADGPPPLDEPPARHVELTRLEKVFWPDEGYTKGDLIDYYRSVSTALLPYLRDRPLVLTRYPDGIAGKSFYQKNAPEFVPDWVRTVRVWSEHAQREIDYFVCDDEDTLTYIANSGAIPLHVWSSRAQTLQNPDWCILDLDPKGAPFTDVVVLARAIRRLCEAIELPSFVKTSGSTGLHVLLPLGGQCTFEQSRLLGQLIARLVEADHPDIATTARTVSKRQGKVYVDFLQNRHGQLLVAPYSVRPLPGAPVSAPLRWREVTSKLEPRQFDIRNLPARLRRQRRDPVAAVLDTTPDLVAALARLAARLED